MAWQAWWGLAPVEQRGGRACPQHGKGLSLAWPMSRKVNNSSLALFVCVCVALLGCAQFPLPWIGSTPLFSTVRERPIVTLDGDQYVTSWSPDGTELTLMSNAGGSWDVWTMTLDGTELRQLTDEPSRDDAAVWSPDGKWLVFSSDRVNRVWPDLWLIDPEQPTTRERLTRGDGKYFQPSWSPDGGQIAFIYLPTGPPYWELRSLSFPDRLIHILSTDNIVRSRPAWSPDGRKIAFVSERIGNPDIWVMEISSFPESNSTPLDHRPPTTLLHPLTHHPAVDKDPSWSPDGRFLAFTSSRAGNKDIWVMDVSAISALRSTDKPTVAPALQQLTHHPAADHYPIWSPDGTKIAFTSDRLGNEDPWVIELGR